MLYTFGLERLSPVKLKGRGSDGRRLYEYLAVDLATLRAIRRGAAAALGISSDLWTETTVIDRE